MKNKPLFSNNKVINKTNANNVEHACHAKRKVLALMVASVLSNIVTIKTYAADPQQVVVFNGVEAEITRDNSNTPLLIPKLNNQNLIENSKVTITNLDFANNSTLITPAVIYGGYQQNVNTNEVNSSITSDVKNTAVEIIGSQIKSPEIYGAHATAQALNNMSAINVNAFADGKISFAKSNSVNSSNTISGAKVDAMSNFYSSDSFSNLVKGSATGSISLDESNIEATDSGNLIFGSHFLASNAPYANQLNSNSAIASIEAVVTGDILLKNSTIRSETNNDIWGAHSNIYSHVDKANDNTLYSNATSNTSANVKGTVTLNDSDVVSKTGNNIYGGFAHNTTTALASNTSTTKSELHVEGDVYLNNSHMTSTSGNNNIYGALAAVHDSASDMNITHNSTSNKVSAKSNIVLNNSTVQNVIGSKILGFDVNGSDGVAQSTITIEGNTLFTSNGGPISLKGSEVSGEFKSYEVFKNNVLNMNGAPITVNRMGNFEQYNFKINDLNSHIVNDSTKSLITVTNSLQNTPTLNTNGSSLNYSDYKITGISGLYQPVENDRFNLVKVNSGNIESALKTPSTDSHLVDVGLTKTANVYYELKDNALVAYLKDIRTNYNINNNLKPIAEGNLAALMNITRTSDMIADLFSIKRMKDGEYSPFVIFKGGRDRYDSGSHIKSSSYRGVFGGKYQLKDFTLGAFLTYGEGDYDTYNSFGDGVEDVLGKGNARHYGFGVVAKYMPEFTGYYVDGALEVGKSRNDFKSNQITGGGTQVSYRSNADYLSGFLGAGYLYQLDNKNKFNTSIKYIGTYLNSDNVVIDGENLDLHSLNSARLNLKEQWQYQYNPKLAFIGALALEHEFNGQAKVSVDGYNLKDSPSVKGSTGIAEIGVVYSPTKAIDNQYLDFRIQGYSGKREGVSALLKLKYTF